MVLYVLQITHSFLTDWILKHTQEYFQEEIKFFPIVFHFLIMMEDLISSNYLKLSYHYKTKNLLGRTNTCALMYMQSEIKDSQYLS